MTTLLQLVLDGPDRGGSLETARQLADPVAKQARFRRLKPDLVKIPVMVNLRGVMAELRDLEIPVAFSAGWSVAQVPWLLLYRPPGPRWPLVQSRGGSSRPSARG